MSCAPTILLVCTGNLCRSAYAEAALRRAAADASGPTVGVTFASSGTHARDGDPAPAPTLAVAATRGLDLGLHRSRPLEAEHVDGADLVLGLAREHRRAVVELSPRAIRRSFTLREFARLADTLTDDELYRAAADPGVDGPRRSSGADTGHAGLSAVVRLIGTQRGSLPPVEASLDDVVDPFGHPDEVHVAMADAIDAALASVVRVGRVATTAATCQTRS